MSCNATGWVASVVLALLVAVGAAPSVEALPFQSCTTEGFTTGGLSRGDGEGVWVPSDFRVAFNCADFSKDPPDPAPVYEMFNTLFGFEAGYPLPAGRFEADRERIRPLFQFIPERPEVFGQWWQTRVLPSERLGIPEPTTGVLLAMGLFVLAGLRGRAPRSGSVRAQPFEGSGPNG